MPFLSVHNFYIIGLLQQRISLKIFYDTLCTCSIIVGRFLLSVCFSVYVFLYMKCSTNVLVNKDLSKSLHFSALHNTGFCL